MQRGRYLGRLELRVLVDLYGSGDWTYEALEDRADSLEDAIKQAAGGNQNVLVIRQLLTADGLLREKRET